MIDADSKVIATKNLAASQTFSLLKYAQLKHRQYGLHEIGSVKELDKKLDKAISSL